MKSVKLFLLFVTAISLVSLTGCGVPKDKYEALLNEKIALEEKVTILTSSKDALKKEYDNLLKDKMDIATKMETMTNEKTAMKGEYDKILDKYQIRPLIRTQKLAAETLRERFPANTFDLVFALNCIDHAYDPEQAILHMIEVVKSGRYVLLEHRPNEAVTENYSGLHQWNFSMSADGDFLISSRFSAVNMTRKHAALCAITCEIVNEGKGGEWLITRIQKK